MHQPSHFSGPHFPQTNPQTRQNSMKSQPLNNDSHINPQIGTTNSSNAKSENNKSSANHRPPLEQLASMEASYPQIKIHQDDLGADSHFSRSEMAAAEQLVQLSDHSDASCATATSDCCNRRISDVDDRSEISSSCSAVRMKIEEIFGRFDGDGDGEENRKRRKKYRSIADIYKTTTPLIKKVRYS